ncbi:MAG: flagellar biosynthesis anti-sigma factor FlgM [Deltaproteobacteria bacterium]|nr:flagellar biosynthesis anti-sigma factor FlgM [Deltaproteobacteria bacterium]
MKKKLDIRRPKIRSRRFNPDEIDLIRVAEITAQMVDGHYHVPAEKVADAILEEAHLTGSALLN